jgi:hypothetical protein
MTREEQLLLPDSGEPGREVSERWPGRGVKALEGTGAWTMLVQMDECFKLVHGQESTMQTASHKKQ